MLTICQAEHGLQIYVIIVYLTILIGNTLDSDKFQDMVKSILKNRESKMLKRNNQCIQVNPRMAEIIKSSQMVSDKIVNLIA